MSTAPHARPSIGPKKSKWSTEEDAQLVASVCVYGTKSWPIISAHVPTRSGKQCRERWIGKLAPSVSRENWTPEEDAVLVREHAISGNRSTSITMQLPGRSSLQVKNRWTWLKRHQNGMIRPVDVPQRAEPPDVVESRPSQLIFEPLAMDNGLFGTAFQKFQAKMFMISGWIPCVTWFGENPGMDISAWLSDMIDGSACRFTCPGESPSKA
jgi:hypothetical protein